MSPQLQQDKFSSVESTVDDWVVEMEKFVHFLAGRNIGMAVEYDDMVQELMLELVKGVQAYPNLPHDQLAAVLRRMMDNRVSELRYRYHVTHRKYAEYDISLSIEVSTRDVKKLTGFSKQSDAESAVPMEELISGGEDPARVYDSKERVLSIRSELTPIAKKVFDSLISGNNMLAMIVWLSAMRSSVVSGHRTVRVRPWHIADALHMDEKEVKEALKEIKRVYRRGHNGN